MKFQVTYRLTHPEYLPTISCTTLSTQSHQQLDQAISRLVKKWRGRGYALRILAVRKKLPGLQENWRETRSSDAVR